MDDRASTTADNLELLHLNQVAIRGALTMGEPHVMAALAILDVHAKRIQARVERPRR